VRSFGPDFRPNFPILGADVLASSARAAPVIGDLMSYSDSRSVTESISIEGSVSHNNTVNKQAPAGLTEMAKTFANQMAATMEARAPAWLIEIATHFAQALADLTGADDPHIADLVRFTIEALNTGRLAD
jgi:hypothetical protein